MNNEENSIKAKAVTAQIENAIGIDFDIFGRDIVEGVILEMISELTSKQSGK